jgi:type VI secretion system ImpJ/VasE family protein
MINEGPIHWHEGLFLQPHHLQYLQRSIYEQFTTERRLLCRYPYGVIESRISDDELENMRISFDRLHVIMPSGLEIKVPQNAELPSLDIKKVFVNNNVVNVSLAVPRWYESKANVIEKPMADDWLVKRMYKLKEIERIDENTGENPQTLFIRQVNARLVLDGDDTTDMEVLPLFRIIHATGENVGVPRRDPNYIPPCMVIDGALVLRELLRDLTNQILASRRELTVQLTRGGFSVDNLRGSQLEQVLRLRTFNTWGTKISVLMQNTAVLTPFEMYLELRQFWAELTGLRPEVDPFGIREYDHDNPAACFYDLSEKIRSLLKGSVQARYMKVSFVRQEQEKCMTAKVEDEAFTLPNEYFLGIKTREDPKWLRELVLDSDKFKLMPYSLVNHNIYGIKLSHELYPPVELPAQRDLHYFRLDVAERARVWDKVKQEKVFAIRWPGVEASDFEVMLFMMVPQLEKK